MKKIQRKTLMAAIGIYLSSAIIFVLILIYAFDYSFKDSVLIAGPVFTALSVFLAFIALRETHEWNRRKFTIDILK